MSKTKCPTCGGDYLYDTTVEDVGEWDLYEAYNRVFVSDLPWYERFLIWLFPRMYILEKYNP